METSLRKKSSRQCGVNNKSGSYETSSANGCFVGRQHRCGIESGRLLKENATRGQCGPNSPLLRGQSGRPLGQRQIQLRFARWFQEARLGGPVSLHSLRHTFATRLYERTGDLHLVQRALGHRQITTTEIYARVGEATLRSTIAAVRSVSLRISEKQILTASRQPKRL